MKLKVVFMGSPEFSIPALAALNSHFNVAGVVTQPERRSGRGKVLTQPPIKEFADSFSLPTIQPRKLNTPDAIEQLRIWDPDVVIVSAYNQILRKEVLELPRYGCINIHASLLPRWRGAAPIQAVILNGDGNTGITIMEMDTGLDTGKIISQESIDILHEDTAGSLTKRLSHLAANLLIKSLPPFIEGNITPRSQENEKATYAPMLRKEDGRLDFNKTSVQLVNQVRAFNPWPGAFTSWNGQILKVHRAHTEFEEGDSGMIAVDPGVRKVFRKYPAVQTTCGLLVLDEVQPAGKKIIKGDSFLRGVREWG